MIEKFVADQEYAGSFVGYDAEAIRGSAGKLDEKICMLFGKVVNGNGDVTSETHAEIDATLAEIRKKCGDEAGDFYDVGYGCALTESKEKVPAEMPASLE